jgi:pilus assembly protein CpaB
MKNKLPLVVAILIGIAAIFAIRSYVNKVEQRAQEQLKGDRIVAAAIDIPAGTEITPQMIAPKEVPRQFIPAQAIQGSTEARRVIGRKTRVALRAGDMIQYSDLTSEARGGLSSIIPAGEGAYTISVPKGVKPGLIQPGDHIDIIGSFSVPKPAQAMPNASIMRNNPTDIANVVLLQNVTVLAVGEMLGGTVRGDSAGGSDLTLALTLREAQLLMFASQQGEIGAVLRREGTTEVLTGNNTPRVTFDNISDIIGDLYNQRNVRQVEIQKGSSTQVVPVSSPSGTK